MFWSVLAAILTSSTVAGSVKYYVQRHHARLLCPNTVLQYFPAYLRDRHNNPTAHGRSTGPGALLSSPRYWRAVSTPNLGSKTSTSQRTRDATRQQGRQCRAVLRNYPASDVGGRRREHHEIQIVWIDMNERGVKAPYAHGKTAHPIRAYDGVARGKPSHTGHLAPTALGSSGHDKNQRSRQRSRTQHPR